MSKHYEDDDEVRSATRIQNRALRLSNRKIRARERDSRDRAEALQFSLIEADASRDDAVVAFGKLWQSGLFDCGPQDYDLMAEIIVEALERAKTAETPAT
jgi:hypothetical protein